jgi:hypothetical protein
MWLSNIQETTMVSSIPLTTMGSCNPNTYQAAVILTACTKFRMSMERLQKFSVRCKFGQLSFLLMERVALIARRTRRKKGAVAVITSQASHAQSKHNQLNQGREGSCNPNTYQAAVGFHLRKIIRNSFILLNGLIL